MGYQLLPYSIVLFEVMCLLERILTIQLNERQSTLKFAFRALNFEHRAVPLTNKVPGTKK